MMEFNLIAYGNLSGAKLLLMDINFTVYMDDQLLFQEDGGFSPKQAP